MKDKIKHDIALETIDDTLVEGEFSIVTEPDGGMSAIRTDGKKIALSGVRAAMLIGSIRDGYVRITLKTGEIALVPKGVGKLPFRDYHAKYNILIGQKIIELILEGRGLAEVCRAPGFPNRGQVARWFIEEPLFRQAYDVSKRVQADFLESEIISIADKGGLTKEEQGLAKLRVDTREKLVKRLKAGYGEKESAVGGVVFNLNFDPSNPSKTKIIEDGQEISADDYDKKYNLDSPEGFVKEEEPQDDR